MFFLGKPSLMFLGKATFLIVMLSVVTLKFSSSMSIFYVFFFDSITL
jgi:hypothetical protein